jgi:hypothetical protein
MTTLANHARMTMKGGPTSSVNLDRSAGPAADQPEVHTGFVAYNPRGRNRRSVWNLPVSCFHPEKCGISDVRHFAIMPPALVEPAILASTSSYGCCPECLAPYKRVVVSFDELEDTWIQTCTCPPADPIPCRVIDPFFGSGTTGEVARRLGRHVKGVELNPDFARLARHRLTWAELDIENQRATRGVGDARPERF